MQFRDPLSKARLFYWTISVVLVLVAGAGLYLFFIARLQLWGALVAVGALLALGFCARALKILHRLSSPG